MAGKKHLHNAHWRKLRWRVALRDRFECQSCGLLVGDHFECDHIVPVSMGGAKYQLNNLQTLCRECHYLKTLDDRREKRKIWERFVASDV